MDVLISIAVLIGLIIFLSMFIQGTIGTFKRNAILAFLCLVFLAPAWIIWVFVEAVVCWINYSKYGIRYPSQAQRDAIKVAEVEDLVQEARERSAAKRVQLEAE